MNLLGMPYLTDALIAAINARRRDEVYRVYVTDLLRGMFTFIGGDCRRYYDILHPTPDDPRTGMEIAVDFLTAHGIPVIDEPQQVVTA